MGLAQHGIELHASECGRGAAGIDFLAGGGVDVACTFDLDFSTGIDVDVADACLRGGAGSDGRAEADRCSRVGIETAREGPGAVGVGPDTIDEGGCAAEEQPATTVLDDAQAGTVVSHIQEGRVGRASWRQCRQIG